MKPWAFWLAEEGGAHVRPLFEGEPHGHGYTGPLCDGETQIECKDGAYPDKLALSTPEYQAKLAAGKAEREAPPVTRREFETLLARVVELGKLI